MQKLKVSDNKRYIVKEDGTPFFWLGDTAWELFHVLNREQAAFYLENRRDKGFTVIQTVVLAPMDGLNIPNAYGQLPLIGNDPFKLNEEYFKHVDFIVDKAEELGLYIGMLPTWGDKFDLQPEMGGAGPEIFTPENARIYGSILGKRYKDKPIIWILGGDRNPENEEHYAIIRSMAEGIKSETGTSQLMTYHPRGGCSSSQFFHEEEWLDFNMFQSGHGYGHFPKNYLHTEEDYNRTPVKPTLDGEPCYEDHPVNFDPINGWLDDFDTRRAAYWSMLAGALGHTYGNHNIWIMWTEDKPPVTNSRTPWYQAVDYPGAFQMSYMRRLFEARPWQTLQPAQQIVLQGPTALGKEIRAALSTEGSFLLAYSSYGIKFKLSLKGISGDKIKAWWFNPRDCSSIYIREFVNSGEMEFKPPLDERRGNDWLLLVDDASKGFTCHLPCPRHLTSEDFYTP